MNNAVKQPINILFSTTDSWISRIIRKITKSEVSHTYITFRDPTLNSVMAMEADWGGFRLVPWKTELFIDQRLLARYSVNVPFQRQLQSLQALVNHLGTAYNYLGLIPLVFRRATRNVISSLDSTKKLTCSESVAMFINGCTDLNLENPHFWTPGKLYNLVRERPDLFKQEE